MRYTVEITSVPDREFWVAEIWDGSEMVAEISRNGGGEYSLQIYYSKEERCRNFDLVEFQASLSEAREKLGI